MKKNFRFLYRYIIPSGRWKKWLKSQTMMVMLASLAFLSTLAWTAPRASEGMHERGAPWMVGAQATLQAQTALPSLTAQPADGKESPTPTATSLPAEYLENADQTIGIALAGALLVLIVIFGVVTAMPRHDR